jgi:hypothetical protein
MDPLGLHQNKNELARISFRLRNPDTLPWHIFNHTWQDLVNVDTRLCRNLWMGTVMSGTKSVPDVVVVVVVVVLPEG